MICHRPPPWVALSCIKVGIVQVFRCVFQLFHLVVYFSRQLCRSKSKILIVEQKEYIVRWLHYSMSINFCIKYCICKREKRVLSMAAVVTWRMTESTVIGWWFFYILYHVTDYWSHFGCWSRRSQSCLMLVPSLVEAKCRTWSLQWFYLNYRLLQETSNSRLQILGCNLKYDWIVPLLSSVCKFAVIA